MSFCTFILKGTPKNPELGKALATLLEAAVDFTLIAQKNKPELSYRGRKLPLPPTSLPEQCCSTPVVNLDQATAAETAVALVKGSTSFRVAKISGSVVLPRKIACSPARRSLKRLPRGLVIAGTHWCPVTQAAAKMATENKLPFYYLDVDPHLAHVEWKELLGSPYLFTGEPADGGFHKTVPIIVLNGRLLGGRAELSMALNDPNLEERMRDESEDSKVTYLSIGTNVSEVTRAAKRCPCVRVVAVAADS